tara:strand:- start:5030 stop:6727 length:1698 start_codon:yes stop_codon:yes gene_type:complete
MFILSICDDEIHDDYNKRFITSIINEKIDNKLYQILYTKNIKFNSNRLYDKKLYDKKLLILFNEYIINNYFNIKNIDDLNKNLDIIQNKVNIIKFYINDIDFYNKLYTYLNKKEFKIALNIYKILLNDIMHNNKLLSFKLINDIFDISYINIFNNLITLIIDFINKLSIDELIIKINNLYKLENKLYKNNFYNLLLSCYIIFLQNKILTSYNFNTILLEKQYYWKWLNINIYENIILSKYINQYIKYDNLKNNIYINIINNYELLYDFMNYNIKIIIPPLYIDNKNKNKNIVKYFNTLTNLKEIITSKLIIILNKSECINNLISNIHEIILSNKPLYETIIHKIIYIASINYKNKLNINNFSEIYNKKLFERLIYYDCINNINLRETELNIIKLFKSYVPEYTFDKIINGINNYKIIVSKSTKLCIYQKSNWFKYFDSDNIINIKNTTLANQYNRLINNWNNNKKLNIDGTKGSVNINLTLVKSTINLLLTPIQFLVINKILSCNNKNIDKILEKELNVNNNIIILINVTINYLLSKKFIIYDNIYKINYDIFKNLKGSYNLLKN